MEGLAAEVAVRGERGVGALGEVEFERADLDVGDVRECAAGDPSLADERVPDEVDPDPVALEDDDEVRECFSAVGDEVRRSLQRHREDGGGRLGHPDERVDGAARGVRLEGLRGARFLQRRQSRGELLGEFDLHVRDVRGGRSLGNSSFTSKARAVAPVRCARTS